MLRLWLKNTRWESRPKAVDASWIRRLTSCVISQSLVRIHCQGTQWPSQFFLQLLQYYILTEVVATSAGVDASLPAALVRRHLKPLLWRVVSRWIRTKVADLQLGKVLGKVLERHPVECTNKTLRFQQCQRQRVGSPPPHPKYNCEAPSLVSGSGDPAGSRGRAPGQGVSRQTPLKLKHFWLLDVQWKR